MEKVFTGNREKFIKITNLLREKNFKVSDAIHIGEDKYEFKEDLCSKLGCNEYYKILAWLDEEENLQYRTESYGFCCTD